MKFDRKREFTPITITLEAPEDVAFLIRVYEKAQQGYGRAIISYGQDNFLLKCKDHQNILERMYRD
jgi:hypothetical protein